MPRGRLQPTRRPPAEGRRLKKKKTSFPPAKVQMGRGLDVGTTFIYCAQKRDSEVNFKTQRNAFFDIERSEFTENILKGSKIKHILGQDKINVVGEDAVKFANVFARDTRRPLRNGIISPEEEEALPIVEAIIKSVLGLPSEPGEICYYSVPGSPVDAVFDIIYHQNIIRGFLEKRGYTPKPINEGLAVVFSELGENDFTGMGISLGGGMANVCLAIMSIPIFSFSVVKAGDWIDEQVARATNTPVTKVTTFKENSLNLRKSEANMSKMEQALSIYYDYLIEYILEEIVKGMGRVSNLPKFEKPIPIIIAGGTPSPSGFLERFKQRLGRIRFPLEVREVRLAPHPLYTVAKGTLIAAIAESRR